MYDCRDLGIGGEAHKKIDAAVRKGGFKIVSGPFELGNLQPNHTLIQTSFKTYTDVLPAQLFALST